MALVLNTNVMAINAQRALSRSSSSMQTSLQRLSSGLRINGAKDDAAGLAISERFTSQIRGLNQAVRNANDGISLLQTAEGALSEISNSLQRMRELAVQSANGTYNASDRASLQDEFDALRAEVTRISDVTEFNNINLLGTTANIDLQIGWKGGADNTLTFARKDIATASFGSGGIANISAAIDISNAASAQAVTSLMSGALDAITNLRGDFGAVQNRLQSAVRNMENVIENQSAARSRIMDTDFAKETANLTRQQIMQQAGVAMLAQANQIPQLILSLLR